MPHAAYGQWDKRQSRGREDSNFRARWTDRSNGAWDGCSANLEETWTPKRLHHMKFVERQKVEKMMVKCREELLAALDKGKKKTAEKCRVKMKAHLADYEYVTRFPKGVPYCLLFPWVDNEELQQRRNQIREIVRKTVESEAQDALPTDGPKNADTSTETRCVKGKNSKRTAKSGAGDTSSVLETDPTARECKKGKASTTNINMDVLPPKKAKSKSADTSTETKCVNGKKSKWTAKSGAGDASSVLETDPTVRKCKKRKASTTNIDMEVLPPKRAKLKCGKAKHKVVTIDTDEGILHPKEQKLQPAKKSNTECVKRKKARSSAHLVKEQASARSTTRTFHKKENMKQQKETHENSVHSTWTAAKTPWVSGRLVESTGTRMVFDSDAESE